MIRINLYTQRAKFNFVSYIKDFFSYVGIVFVLVVAVNVGLFYINTQKSFKYHASLRQWRKKEPGFKELQSLKKELEELRKKKKTFKGNISLEVPFSKIMFVLADKLPVNLWFNHFSVNNDVLMVKGSAIDMEKEAFLSVKEYVNVLSESIIPEVYSGGIKIVALERSRLKDKSIVKFELEFTKEESAMVKK